MLLGLDIGTTKVAAVIADGAGNPAAVASAVHHAGLPAPAGRAEQDPAIFLGVAWRAVRELPAPLRRQVRAVGITGQMHGVLLVDAEGRPVSPLVTWQDQRCLEGGFLEELVARAGGPLSTGFGCATLAWLAAHRALPPGAASAGTIQDYAVAALCGQTRPLTDPTDAAAWGLFDLRTLAWDLAAVRAAGLEARLLPEVRPCGSRAGAVSPRMAHELGLPPGIPVAVALGDNQASLLATLGDELHEIAITIGTGAQASAVLPPEGPIDDPAPGRPCELRPYPGGRYLAAAAPLCGGSAWAWLARTVASWLRDLGLPAMPEDDLYAKLNSLGLAAKESLAAENRSAAGDGVAADIRLAAAGGLGTKYGPAAEDGPCVAPHFLGERHDPALRASITRLGLDGLQLGPLARSLARGILTNLRDMLGPRVLEHRVRLVGSGNALRRNPLLRLMAEEVFAMPLVMPEAREEAALGAARNALLLAPE